MRLLFVSGTTVGGSGRSQRELAGRLSKRGHEVLFLVDPETQARPIRWLYEQLSDLSVHFAGHPGAGVVRAMEVLPGRSTEEVVLDGLRHLTSPVPENAAAAVLDSFRPDVVIGSSVLRLCWRKVRADCRSRHIPTVLYLREEVALNHFGDERPADVIMANAASIAGAVERLGYGCDFIPSVIETEVTSTNSTRRVAMVVNPIESRGIEIVWRIAERMPDVKFVLQESWPLNPLQLDAVKRGIAMFPNVEFRRLEPPGPGLYRDARVLLVPYRVDNRPRVIAEAQANGIPVVVGRVPALTEAIGEGGISVSLDDIGEWCAAIRRLWDSEGDYTALSEAALLHSRREEIDPTNLAVQFEVVLTRLVSSQR